MKVLYSLLLTLLFIIILQCIGWSFEALNLYSMFSVRLTQFIITLSLILIFRKSVLIKLLKYEEKYVVWAIILGLLYPYFQWILSILYFFNIQDTAGLLNFDFKQLLEFQVVSALLVSVCEELFFKIAIQNELAKKYIPVISIGITAILFSLIHLSVLAIFFEHFELTFYSSYSTFAGGVISAILFHKSKSLYPSIAFHITWNLTIQIMVFH